MERTWKWEKGVEVGRIGGNEEKGVRQAKGWKWGGGLKMGRREIHFYKV